MEEKRPKYYNVTCYWEYNKTRDVVNPTTGKMETREVDKQERKRWVEKVRPERIGSFEAERNEQYDLEGKQNKLRIFSIEPVFEGDTEEQGAEDADQ